MYQKVALRFFLSFTLSFFLGCSLLPSQARITSVSGGMEILLPFHVENDLRYVYLSLSDREKPLRFLLDTGSRYSLLDERFFTQNHLKKKLNLVFTGGRDHSYRRTRTASLFDKSRILFRDLTFYSNSFSGNLASIDGILGVDALWNKTFILEYPDQIRFLETNSSTAEWKRQFSRIEPLLFFSGLPVLQAEIGTGEILNLILDSGAEISLLEIRQTVPGKVWKSFWNRDAKVLNILGQIQEIKTLTVDRLCLLRASDCVDNLEILSSGLPVEFAGTSTGVRIQGILGVNWLNEHRILLDMKRSLIGIVGKDGGEPK
ncbi:hypothetical protein EHQ12_02140 [Leptospira gomenensis]|uniref:Aspartyl protease n=1 Tax=Leptospira gomenensis TaxID=2484974 RepID=A0A5F1YGY1_9LEPT|nr:hypothetical protein [Leptospira gomenensis]TGK31524.1 hypothetical protein EHQ17_14035 [Leptospira gomenensis]TGK44174.1 hypothetical protein EHQ12_02140 [Leptospira gomenensis]TGK46229.1 hypothetical protein EHQ07_07270 [Leptospira gomenensis]TGK54754.1 hypothetical protein EHQ13_18860 [Leptospira gomenensis]